MYGTMTHDNVNNSAQDQIDRNLRRVYEALLNEDVPDRFVQILAALRKKDLKGTNST